MDKVKFIIPGEPVAKERPRFTKSGIVYTPKKTKIFVALVRKIADKHFDEPLDGPIKMELVFCFPRPKSKIWKRKPMPREWKTSRPDIDNLFKAVTDALNGIAYKDDRQIVELHVKKYICSGDEKPHTEVIVEVV